MNEHEQERVEAELRRARPARPPEQFLTRLLAAKRASEPVLRERNRQVAVAPVWWRLWWWLAPGIAVAVGGLLVVRANFRAASIAEKAPLAAALGFKADGVRVDQELVSSYDVVATLPGGEPVRFHCREWNDQLVVTDTNRGVEIEQDSPRVEVVPVRFETY